SKNVFTSHILGTLFNVTFQFKSKAAHRIGSAAFFEPLIFILQLNSFFHFTTNTLSQVINYIL
ncbi:hypothetical protein HOF65_00850, partial [bacterium]|nr:hypothetical protein [bacterium]